MTRLRKILWTALLLVLCTGHRAFACAACYGQSDSPMAEGMNWGIMALLAVITVVLCCVAGFFIYIANLAKKNQKLEHG